MRKAYSAFRTIGAFCQRTIPAKFIPIKGTCGLVGRTGRNGKARTRGHLLTENRRPPECTPMFNTDFLAGMLVLGLTFAAALALASLTGIDPTWTLVGLAAAVWGLAALWERRLSSRLPETEVQPIRVDWNDKLNDTDFASGGEDTRLSLSDLGLTPETALDQSFVFATEHSESGGDILFEGTFADDGDRIVIRATEPV